MLYSPRSTDFLNVSSTFWQIVTVVVGFLPIAVALFLAVRARRSRVMGGSARKRVNEAVKRPRGQNGDAPLLYRPAVVAHRSLTGKVARFQLEPPPQGRIDATPAQWIASHVVPGATVDRYRRTWIVGQTEEHLGVLYGRIGYERDASQFEIYDEEQKDFVGVSIRTGNVTPFAINLNSLVLAFQTKPPEIVMGSVANAIAALLSEDDARWRAESLLARRMTLNEWVQSVDRVTRIRFFIRQPNPHYQDAPDLEALIEQAQAEVGRLELQADGGLDLNSPFVEQTLRHVDEHSYGEARLTGSTVDGTESVYATDIQTVEEVTEAPTHPETGEVGQASLAEAVAAEAEDVAAEAEDVAAVAIEAENDDTE